MARTGIINIQVHELQVYVLYKNVESLPNAEYMFMCTRGIYQLFKATALKN